MRFAPALAARKLVSESFSPPTDGGSGSTQPFQARFSLKALFVRGRHSLCWQVNRRWRVSLAALWVPHCQNRLRRVTGGHGKTVQTRFGHIRIQQDCKRSRKWLLPVDSLFGLAEEGTHSPAVQEIASLVVSQMPARQAD